jgi:hypothetical protein
VHATFWQLHAFPISDDCFLVTAIRFDLVPRLDDQLGETASLLSDPFEFCNELLFRKAIEHGSADRLNAVLLFGGCFLASPNIMKISRCRRINI